MLPKCPTVRASLLLLLLVAASGTVSAAEPAGTEPEPTAQVRAAKHSLSAQIQELQQITQLRLVELNTLLRSAGDPQTRLGLEREVRNTKLGFELEVLGLQLNHLKARVAVGTASEERVLEVKASIEALELQRGEEEQ